MLDPVRRIVSGRKARYQQEGFDLDLCRLTDRIIIMGYPAVGVASLYRNKRSDVKRFLEPYAPHYRIFNLCPLYENSYEATAFAGPPDGDEDEDSELRAEEQVLGGPVERYPWPDHHPPPLSLMRVMVEGARRWYLQDERNVVVIHCKAGKGRSGTFAISLLLALPGLPSAPRTAPGDEEGEETEEEYRALNPEGVLGKSAQEIEHLSLEDKLRYLLHFHTARRMSPGATKYGVSISSQRRFLGYWVRLLDKRDPRTEPAAPPRRIVIEYVKVSGPGLGGVGRLLSGGNKKMAIQLWRYKDSIAARLREKEVELEAADSPSTLAEHDWDDRSEMLVHVGTLVEGDDGANAPKAPATRSRPSTAEPGPPPAVATSHAVGTSDVSSAASASSGSLPSAVLGTPCSSVSSSRSSTPLPPAASNGPDQLPADSPSGQSRVLVPYAAYLPPNQGAEKADTAPRSHRAAREAVNADGGIVLDADREIMLKFLVGRTGDRHGKLPAMAALALSWFIPSFEAAPPTANSAEGACDRSRIVIDGKDLDFRKPFAGLEAIEVGWRWL